MCVSQRLSRKITKTRLWEQVLVFEFRTPKIKERYYTISLTTISFSLSVMKMIFEVPISECRLKEILIRAV